MNSSRIAFFDVDDTLVKGNCGFYTTLNLVRHGILKKRRFLQAFYHLAASLFYKQDIARIYQIAINDMAGSTWDKILEIGRESFERDVKPRLYVEGLDLINQHKAQGNRVVLLTSAPYMLIRVLQDFLEIEEAYCMGPEIVDSILTKKLKTPICHAEGKVHFAKISAKKHGVSLSQCYFYSDHISDLPLLKKVGNPIAVNPTRSLTRVAQQKKWPILRFEKILGFSLD